MRQTLSLLITLILLAPLASSLLAAPTSTPPTSATAPDPLTHAIALAKAAAEKSLLQSLGNPIALNDTPQTVPQPDGWNFTWQGFDARNPYLITLRVTKQDEVKILQVKTKANADKD